MNSSDKAQHILVDQGIFIRIQNENKTLHNLWSNQKQATPTFFVIQCTSSIRNSTTWLIELWYNYNERMNKHFFKTK